jgi:pimeloyl-ACP methyl ester carboxylesterase
MKGRVHFGKWKSPAAERRFHDAEGEYWQELWPDPPRSFDLKTHLGTTRAYRWPGDDARTPVVFLHGSGGTALAWSGYVTRVGGRVAIGIDTIGDAGRSKQDAAVEDAADYAAWLDETLAGLDVERAHLVGMSYGGFLALNQAARLPNRVASLTLLDPAGLAPIKLGQFIRWGMSVMAASKLPRALRTRAARRLRMPAIEDDRLMRMLRLSAFGFTANLVPPDPLTDEQLGAIAAPVLLFVAEHSEAFSPTEAVRRAETSIADAEVRVVAGAGHALPISHTDDVIAAMDAFLDRHREGALPDG